MRKKLGAELFERLQRDRCGCRSKRVRGLEPRKKSERKGQREEREKSREKGEKRKETIEGNERLV
jgi:hypothetical protein